MRQRPKIHSFKYPLTFAVVDLDEATDLFGNHAVIGVKRQQFSTTSSGETDTLTADKYEKGKLWPLSTLMLLRDEDHLKNGEGLQEVTYTTSSSIAACSSTATTTTAAAAAMNNTVSMRERVINLIYERTNGKLNLKQEQQQQQQRSRKILLVTHLMYFGYCFNPVSFFFILNEQDDGIEAVVLEVSNTPWNEMSLYVLHPSSVDVTMSQIYPSDSPKSLSAKDSVTTNNNNSIQNNNVSSSSEIKTYYYRCEKKFHVSPFMTMDHDYEWKFQLEDDRIVAQVQMYRHDDDDDNNNNDGSFNHEEDVVVEEKKDYADENDNSGVQSDKKGILYFTAGFDIHRTVKPNSLSFPLQLSKIILRYPIYCFVIQIWIHYEALRLLLKGIQFIPHPEGSETGASKAIALVMRPVFAILDLIDDLIGRLKGGGEKKKTKSD